MNVDVYINKRFDTDLISLYCSGYSIALMMRDALIAYANGRQFNIFIAEQTLINLNEKKSFRVRIKIKNPDNNVTELMASIKDTYKSNFCKQLLRNAFLQQNLMCYMKKEESIRYQKTNASYLILNGNVKNVSLYKKKQAKNLTFEFKEPVKEKVYEKELQSQKQKEAFTAETFKSKATDNSYTDETKEKSNTQRHTDIQKDEVKDPLLNSLEEKVSETQQIISETDESVFNEFTDVTQNVEESNEKTSEIPDNSVLLSLFDNL